MYYILFKSEPLGKYSNTEVCYVTGLFILLEIQRLKLGIKDTEYHQELDETVSCTKINMEATHGLVQSRDRGATSNCLYFWILDCSK